MGRLAGCKLDGPATVLKTPGVNLRQFVKYWLWRDTTHHGEFRAMWRLLPRDCPRLVVDVGANDGFYGSNSFPFVARGWRAVLVEPHPKVFAKLQRLHRKKSQVTCLNLACAENAGSFPLHVGDDGEAPSTSTLSDDPELLKTRTQGTLMVRVERLSDVLAAQQVPPDFGVLTVDVEGMDLEVLRGLDFSRWRPRVIITEDYLPKFAAKAEWLQRNDYQLHTQIAGNSIWHPCRLAPAS